MEQKIDDWMVQNGFDAGEAVYVIVKYLLDDPSIIPKELRRQLIEATDQEIYDAMDTATDDKENSSFAEVLK